MSLGELIVLKSLVGSGGFIPADSCSDNMLRVAIRLANQKKSLVFIDNRGISVTPEGERMVDAL